MASIAFWEVGPRSCEQNSTWYHHDTPTPPGFKKLINEHGYAEFIPIKRSLLHYQDKAPVDEKMTHQTTTTCPESYLQHLCFIGNSTQTERQMRLQYYDYDIDSHY